MQKKNVHHYIKSLYPFAIQEYRYSLFLSYLW